VQRVADGVGDPTAKVVDLDCAPCQLLFVCPLSAMSLACTDEGLQPMEEMV
jgi:hypothetical protein